MHKFQIGDIVTVNPELIICEPYFKRWDHEMTIHKIISRHNHLELLCTCNYGFQSFYPVQLKLVRSKENGT